MLAFCLQEFKVLKSVSSSSAEGFLLHVFFFFALLSVGGSLHLSVAFFFLI